ncbi:hypothetical protein Clacol_007005 [Clathrus columnatus]|uniref:Uncharacterized protein n=1 Tax=Clathrus columnatus TaxID=1419009 RepID=A0AAV5ALH0_9AGAM|nr:hypothetical protein Clacol_007005 [Clathrus columnatus]
MSNLRHLQPFEIEYAPQHFETILAPEVITYRVRRDLVSLGVSHSAQLDITRDKDDGNIFTVVGLTANESDRQLITELANRKTISSKMADIPNLDSPVTTRRNDGGKAKLFEPNKKVTSFAIYRLNKKGRSKASYESPEEDDTEPNNPLASSSMQTITIDEPMDLGQAVFNQKEPDISMTRLDHAEEKIVRLEMELKKVKQDLEWRIRNDQIIDGLNARILKLEERWGGIDRP